jgi:tetratricopeptide (TPR) repeat protein
MKKLIFLFCLAVGFLTTSTNLVVAKEPLNPLKKFQEATKFYRAGNYQAAIADFEEIIASGYKNSAVYFNLGNCYYKQQEFAKSILNYERAKKYDPLDEDISYNLKLAYSNTVDKIEPIPLLFYERWWQLFLNLFSPSIWSVIAIVFLWLAGGLAVAYLMANTISGKKISFLSSSLFLLVAIFVFVIASCSNNNIQNNHGAIVIESSVYIKSSPEASSTNLFMLHAGTRIEVIENIEGWKKIKIANGNSGWIKEDAIEVI